MSALGRRCDQTLMALHLRFKHHKSRARHSGDF
uniref:Uncharacterized protein n=1 Tax=Anguilla anguilla TaxID=7936 RepID=A0A0E9SLU8_ANGAN